MHKMSWLFEIGWHRELLELTRMIQDRQRQNVVSGVREREDTFSIDVAQKAI